MKVVRENRQSILDICVQHTGSIESLVDIMELNSLSALDIELQQLEIPTAIKPSVVNFFKTNDHRPATHQQTGGIDFDPRDYNMNDFY